ncbi:MAG: hypothetical protein RLZZ618_353 [Pseudomonadota bacterium]|jgi:opacity protein-like surface antigen
MKICRPSSFRTALAAAALLLASSAHAAAYQWNVEFDFFNGGGKGTGSFVSNGFSITDWDITTFRDWSQPIYEEPVFGYHYTSDTSTLDLSTFGNARLLRNDSPQDFGSGMGNWLDFSFLDRLARGGSFSGGALERTLSFGGSSLSQTGSVRFTSSPLLNPIFEIETSAGGFSVSPLFSRSDTSAVAAPVPEPETIGMLALGLGLVGVAVRRRRAAR